MAQEFDQERDMPLEGTEETVQNPAAEDIPVPAGETMESVMFGSDAEADAAGVTEPAADAATAVDTAAEPAAAQAAETGEPGGTYHMQFTSGDQPGSAFNEAQAAQQVPPAQNAASWQNQGGTWAPVNGGGWNYQTNTPQPPDPTERYHVTASTDQKKKNRGGLIALGIVAALLIGLGGGIAAGYGVRSLSDKKTAAALSDAGSTQTQTEEAAPEAGTSRSAAENADTAVEYRGTTIEVTTNSDDTQMTPKDVYENYVNAVVAISNEGVTTNYMGQVSQTASSGSGFILTEDGYIVTNNHVIANAEKLTVTMTNGEEYEAELVGTDAENDVALIKIEAEGLPTVSIGSSSSLEVGDQLCAIGNPLGELTNTLTVGYLSALDREILENGIPINMFQTDCAINSGNSGGPIFDMHGNVVGITTAKYSTSSMMGGAAIEGIGFCIPVDDAMSIVDDLLQYGYVRGKAYLGINCQAISSAVSRYYNLPAGVYVETAVEGYAAEKAGIQEGDIITEVDGTEVTTVAELKLVLREHSPGETVSCKIYRSGKEMTIDVTLDEQPG